MLDSYYSTSYTLQAHDNGIVYFFCHDSPYITSVHTVLAAFFHYSMSFSFSLYEWQCGGG